MTKPQRGTSDSPRAHDAPPNHDLRPKHDVVTLASVDREPALSADPKELNRYLDALLERDRLTPFTVYGESYRALERGDIDIFEHDRNVGKAIPNIPITTDAAGVDHLSPSWKAFDPGLAREIRYQIRAIETANRYPAARTLQLPFDGIPARGERPAGIVLPSPQYRGAKAGRKIVGTGRPLQQSLPSFYLPRMTELADTLSESSKRDTGGRASVVPDADQFEAIALCFDMARAVTEHIVGIDALASVIVRLGAPASVKAECFRLLGHRDRKRLGKALASR